MNILNLSGTVCDLNKCTGCGVCIEVCQKSAIVQYDNLTAINSYIDAEKCISCGACRRICPSNNLVELKKPIEWKQGWINDEIIRNQSSSGGFAIGLAQSFLRSGGFVCSCLMSEGNFVYEIINNEYDLIKFQGSKYVKSNPQNVYVKVKNLLASGEKVLMIGLPCHIAAMRNYIGKNLESKFYSVDLICHGSPSPMLLSKYLRETFGIDIKELANISFRNKSSFELRLNGKRLVPHCVMDRYTMAFLDGLSYTENCYSCQFARLERCSDITIGDSWASQLSDEEVKRGISLALCQTEKGKELLFESDLKLYDVNLERAVSANRQLSAPSKKHPNRNKFEKAVLAKRGFKIAVTRAITWRSLKQDVKETLVKIIGGGGKFFL